MLLIEDDPGDADLLQELLSEEKSYVYTLEWVERLQTGLERLALGGIDVVLLDLSLPDSHGLDTFIAVNTHAPALPAVVLSGLDDETIALEAVRQGAQDYLVKGQVDGRIIARVIRYAIERKSAEEALRESGVDTALTHRSDRPTTLAFVELTDGQARYAFYDENTAGRMLTADALPDLPDEVRALFFGGISLAAEPCGDAYETLMARAGGRVTMLDPNVRRMLSEIVIQAWESLP